MNNTAVPAELFTERLYLRCWQISDAERLLAVLEANIDHLGPWIPAHVAEPTPLEELEGRLAGYAADFLADRNWRFALFAEGGTNLVGEASMFPRSPAGRVELPSADRVEVGYWLGRDATGNGYASEATRAMLALATTLPGMCQVEIRCDPRNASSAAIPRRLGFRLVSDGNPGSPQEPDMMLWVYSMAGETG